MEESQTESVDQTVLNIPKPTACSTVIKYSYQKKGILEEITAEDSLGILNVDNLPDFSQHQIDNANSFDLSHQLKEQRYLANSSLQGANRVASLPSKYLRLNLSRSSMSNVNLTSESMISEIDLTKSPPKSPKNTSTPRKSVIGKEQRNLANSSLQRANRVASLPSKYLRPNLSRSSMSNVNLTSESMISEIDLTKSPPKSPKNTSTPRKSVIGKEQRNLANSSLQRANRVASLPSKYLRPNLSRSSMSNVNLTSESMISEIDLTKSPPKSPKNTSTPRKSVMSNVSNDMQWLRLAQSVAHLSYQLEKTEISIDNPVKELQKAMNTVDNGVSQIDSQQFSPGEETVSMLFADEMSWRRQNEIPLTDDFSQSASENISYGKVSVGEFVQQKSDTLSEFKMAISPVKRKKPVRLIDSSVSFEEEHYEEKEGKNKKSLSISTIKKLLAETDNTPRRVTSFLLKQGQKLSEDVIDQSSLPVSRDSSYTSNYSDNEAITRLSSNKENIDTYNIPQQNLEIKSAESFGRPLSAGSSRSSSSALTSLPNGKLPIESTKTELIWGCVKVDKCVTQEFLLRNKTSKRLCFQMSVSGQNFKIRKDNRQESEPLNTAKILLHPHESRAIIVSFIPTKIGAAVDELSFISLDPNLQQTKKQSVRLYGYGGFGKVDILNLTKDIAGRFWLSLGKLDNHSILIQKFILKNTGTLPSFVLIDFKSNKLFAFANVSVVPNFFVLSPNEQREITITIVLSMEDRQLLLHSFFYNSMVSEIGNLRIISDTEVNRGRLRRLCQKCTEKGLLVDSLIYTIKEKIKGEIMPADLYLFKENAGNLKEIFKLFSRTELVLIIEQDPEVTIIRQYADESVMYNTLSQDGTVMCLETTNTLVSCKLEPTSIILVSPTKINDNLFLTSECSQILNFEVMSNPEGLDICPKEGKIAPGEKIVINVSLKLVVKEKKVFKVSVYVDNEVYEATVKITFLPNQRKMN